MVNAAIGWQRAHFLRLGRLILGYFGHKMIAYNWRNTQSFERREMSIKKVDGCCWPDIARAVFCA